MNRDTGSHTEADAAAWERAHYEPTFDDLYPGYEPEEPMDARTRPECPPHLREAIQRAADEVERMRAEVRARDSVWPPEVA